MVTIEEFDEMLDRNQVALKVAKNRPEILYGLLEESAEVRERAIYMLLSIKEW